MREYVFAVVGKNDFLMKLFFNQFHFRKKFHGQLS